MRLDLVIPIYNERENLPELARRVTQVCDGLADLEWRVIYVNDASSDDSLRIILEQRQADPRFTVIELSRNFGHQPAISAGLAHADADAVVIMDGDLQDPPEVITQFLDAWRANAQVVLGLRRSRQEHGLRRLGFDLFHRLFQRVSDYPIAANTGIFGLLDRQAVDQLCALTERNRFLPGLRSWIGFEQRVVYYDRQARAGGEPKQTMRRLIRYALDGVFSFSYKPLRMMTYVGTLISTLGFLVALYFIGKRLLGFEVAQIGFTTLVTLVLILGGVQLLAIGLLGEYLGRIYDEVKARPLYIVKARHGLVGHTQG
jgi:glycosyltransferase involved in cell wall biosynthesis